MECNLFNITKSEIDFFKIINMPYTNFVEFITPENGVKSVAVWSGDVTFILDQKAILSLVKTGTGSTANRNGSWCRIKIMECGSMNLVMRTITTIERRAYIAEIGETTLPPHISKGIMRYLSED